MVKTAARSSVSSRGSPTEENNAVPPTGSYSRGSSISGPPPPIPERTTPGPGSIGRHGSVSSVSDLPEQPTEKAPTLSSVGRRDSQGKFHLYLFLEKEVIIIFSFDSASQSSTSSKTSAARPVPQSQNSVVEDAEDTMKNLRKTFAGIFGDM